MSNHYINGYFQREPKCGITEYTRNPNTGKIIIAREHHSWANFILSTWEKASNYSVEFNVLTKPDFWDMRYDKTVVCWNQDGSLYHPDDIAGDINSHYIDICAYNNIRNGRFYQNPVIRGNKNQRKGPHRKNPRTQQEVRQSITWRDDADLTWYDHQDEDNAGLDTLLCSINPHNLKPRRQRFDIPNSWDKFHKRSLQRSWKSQRRTQWR